MRAILLAVMLLLLGALAPPRLPGQGSGEEEVHATLRRLFDGMRQGDSAAVRSVFHSEARMFTTALRNGQPRLQGGSVDEFVRAVGQPHDEIWDERIDNLVIQVDDPLASAWMDYAFHLGDRLSHCGVNAFQLVRTMEGWKVIQIIDTRRAECTG